MKKCSWILAAAVCLGLSTTAQTAIKNLIPLKDVLATEQYIFSAKIDKIDSDKPSMILTTAETFKGKPPFQRLPVNLSGDAEAKRENQTPKLLKRIAHDMSIMLFVHRQGRNYVAFAYSNGTWFQMLGQGDPPEGVVWSFNHLEPYFRRTFKGTTEELKKVVVDGLAGKSEPPKPDEKEPPGIGPEIEPSGKPKGPPGPSDAPPLAVIPTFVIIGPLAILATMFPAVFGGLALLMRRWMVALSLTCFLSTAYFVRLFFYRYLADTWFGSDSGMWLSFAALSAMSAIWAIRRYRKAAENQELDAWLPGKWDRIAIVALSVCGLAIVIVAVSLGRPLLRSPWLDVLVTFAPLWITAAALPYYRGERVTGASLETVFLWSLVVVCGLAGAMEGGRGSSRSRVLSANLEVRSPRMVEKPAWKFEPSGSGMILSSPCLADGRVYVGALVGAGFSQHGRLYCIDAETGAEIWSFDDAKGLRGVFSSPCVANGKVYFGEGFHEDRDCRVICLSADKGEKQWEHPTTSHTESAPVVEGGKLYIGAGDDGLYCLNADDGKVIWQRKELHIDANPVVHAGRVYIASGVGDIYKTTLFLCLDANTGKEQWGVPLEFPSFATATVTGSQVFIGAGNGNFSVSDPNPRGIVLCLDARTGKRIWQFDAKDAVLSRASVDDTSVWFAARDGFVYCVRRSDGRLRWKYDAKAPIVSSPVFVSDGDGVVVRSLYVAGSDGIVTCLDPDRGTPYWSRDLSADVSQPQVLIDGTPLVVSRVVEGVERRSIFIGFGAGRDLSQLSTSLPRFLRLEDEVK